MLATPRPEPIRKPQEVFLIDCIEHFHNSTLDYLFFQCRYSKWTLPPIWLRYVFSPRWKRPICTPVNASMQIHQVGFKVLLVIFPCHPINPGCRIPFQPGESFPE